MSPKIEVVIRLLQKAREDLKSCNRLLQGSDPIASTACFHAQQAAEKTLKAFLQWSDSPAPRTHSLNTLVQHCQNLDPTFSQIREVADSLTPYAVEVRYESARAIDEAEGLEAHGVSHQVVNFVMERIRCGVDRMIAAEEQVEQAREAHQMSALRAELDALKGETGKDKEAK